MCQPLMPEESRILCNHLTIRVPQALTQQPTRLSFAFYCTAITVFGFGCCRCATIVNDRHIACWLLPDLHDIGSVTVFCYPQTPVY
jgi:hypothetical protein